MGKTKEKSAEDSMKPKAEKKQWSKKLSLSGPWVAVIALTVACSTAGLRYYLVMGKDTHTARLSHGVGSSASASLPRSMREMGTHDTASGKSGTRGGSAYGGGMITAEGSRILSRPLFDNLTVTVTVELSRGVTVVQGESVTGEVEARFISLVPDGSMATVDAGMAGATLKGTTQPLFAQRRLGFSFSELVTAHGERYAIQAVAVDPATRALGIAANYSSGLGTRMLGATISSALNTASQVATSRVLQNTADSSDVTRALMRQSLESGGQPANEMNQELTRDLRETKAVLSVDAGTVLTLRLKASVGGVSEARK